MNCIPKADQADRVAAVTADSSDVARRPKADRVDHRMVRAVGQGKIAAAPAAVDRADRVMPVPAGRTARVGQGAPVAAARAAADPVMEDRVVDVAVAAVGKAGSRPWKEWSRTR